MDIQTIESWAESIGNWLVRLTGDKKLEADERFAVATLTFYQKRLQPALATNEGSEWLAAAQAMFAANVPPVTSSSPVEEPSGEAGPNGSSMYTGVNATR